MNAVTKDLVEYFVAEGLGVKGGKTDWALYMNQEPASGKDNGPASDNVITLYDQAGQPPARCINSQKTAFFTAFQIRARGNVQTDVRERLKLLRDKLTSIEGWLQLNGTDYMNFQPLSDMFLIARDDRQRWIWAVNYQVLRK